MVVGFHWWWQWMMIAVAALITQLTVSGGEYFKPFNVSYDHRALILDGKRRMLISAGIHYPRATPEMWPNLIAKSKEGGADVIETYVFWNVHEPIRGQYDFEGRYDIIKFVKLVASEGLYLLLRIGPYVCAEWNFGGFPVWLRDIPGIEFRTDNEPFKEEMQCFVKKIVDLIRAESLFSWQGGPVIMLQIENEYGNIEHSFGAKGRQYIQWAAKMAVGLDARVPWIMCKQVDAPEYIIDTCNAYYCDGFRPNSNKKPTIWTENWDGWYADWGERLPHRPVEDLAFAVARFFQRGGSFMNYYMFFGGTNFGRSSGGPKQITSYDYDAPVDEYGLLSQPKWGHLRDLHAAIKLCEPALVAADSSQYIKLGPMQEAHVYRGDASSPSQNISVHETRCSAFLANIDEHKSASVKFLGKNYVLPPWSVSILPDCRNTAFNTAKVGAQTSIKAFRLDDPSVRDDFTLPESMIQEKTSHISLSWMTVKEPIGAWGDNNFTSHGLLEHLNVTKDFSDYLWYMTRVYISDDDLLYWEENEVEPSINIDSMRDVVVIFINGRLSGSAQGNWIKVVHPVHLMQGFNDIVLLTQTVGLQNYGAFLEKDGAGFRGQVKLMGCKNGEIDLTKGLWTYQVGLKGEYEKIYTTIENNAGWTELLRGDAPLAFSWYKTNFDAPIGTDPVALDLRSMGKGQAWINGQHIGRYWTLVAPKDGCSKTCNYRGSYGSDKCVTNCGKPTQIWYHVPRSWLKKSDNLLVIFEEMEKSPFNISVNTRSTKTICAQVSEDHYPPLDVWLDPAFIHRNSSRGNVAPLMHLQCEDDHLISSIEFASYGTPRGSCQTFLTGSCHATSSSSVVSQACLGRNSCTVRVSNANFGDPCRGTTKRLAVQLSCSSSLSSAHLAI